jgi:hypothetical protein
MLTLEPYLHRVVAQAWRIFSGLREIMVTHKKHIQPLATDSDFCADADGLRCSAIRSSNFLGELSIRNKSGIASDSGKSLT